MLVNLLLKDEENLLEKEFVMVSLEFNDGMTLSELVERIPDERTEKILRASYGSKTVEVYIRTKENIPEWINNHKRGLGKIGIKIVDIQGDEVKGTLRDYYYGTRKTLGELREELNRDELHIVVEYFPTQAYLF